jgi:transglutaminase-like putative cysteine protease/tetratricopeptide (TPR) repeat protein
MAKIRAATALSIGVVAAVGTSTWARADNPPPGIGSSSVNATADAYTERLQRAAGRLATEAARPESAAALAELALLDESVPPDALEAAIQPALAAGAHPLVAAQAALLLAHLEDERGAAAAATARRTSLGFLAPAFVIGPFGEGRASFGTRFPPELEASPPALGRRYPGKGHEVSWRPAEGATREGALLLDALLRPDDQAVAYVVAFVHSDADRGAALRLGSPGPLAVWLNGQSVFKRYVVRAAALDQDAVGVRLGRGWNRILIKTVVVDGAWRLYARLTDPAGAPLPAGVTGGQPTDPATATWARASRGRAPAVSSLDGLLARRAERAGSGAAAAAAWADLARVLGWLAPRDREERAAGAAAGRAAAMAPSFQTWWVAADVADTDDERRRALERALEGDDHVSSQARALALVRLAELARIDRREARASAELTGALALDPGCWPAVLAAADMEADAGLPLAAVHRIDALPAGVRALPRVQRVAARLAEAAERRTDSDRTLAALAETRQIEVDLLHQLASRARARGDGAEARRRLAAAAALRPDLPSLGMELARLDEGAGDAGRALADLQAQATRLPDDPPTLIALGKLLRRQGRAAEALERLRAALTLRPQDPELKRYVDHLLIGDRADPSAPDELAKRFADDARNLVPAGPVPATPADPAVVLLDRRVVRMHRNGLARTFAQRVVQVLTARGAEDNKEFEIHYTPGSEEVDVRQARVYRRDPGGVLQVFEAADRSDEDLSEPWYGLYYDNRAEVIRFEGLRPGDVIEIQYLVDDVGAENQMADYFGDLQYVAETIPKRRWDYTLLAPASRPIHSNVPRVAGLEQSTAVEGDERVYRFAARDVPKIASEPAMPGTAEVAPYLHVSTYASWQDVAAWYWHLIEDQLTADEEVRHTARSLLAPGMTERDKVRAVHDFVVENTRYVGLEFGIHGYKPYKVTQVLARRFGDCKDKASLMLSLLREVGVPAELVLVRTRRGGRLDPAPASLAIFDHAIVYVPSLDLYLDGTAEFSGMTELPAEDQGVMVLRVSPAGGTLAETPLLPASASRVERRWDVGLDASGDARVTEALSIRGQAAANWREHYQSAGERADRYGRVWSGRFPGARLTSVEMPAIGDREQPVTVRSTVAVPRFGQARGTRSVELPVSGRDADFVRTYARLSERHDDLVLAYPWQHDEELTYKLPAGWKLQAGGLSDGAARDVESAFGRFHLDVRVDGGLVRVRSFLDVERSRIAPDEYARFRAFLGEIDATLQERLLIGSGEAGS